jgi:hypothetical protein
MLVFLGGDIWGQVECWSFWGGYLGRGYLGTGRRYISEGQVESFRRLFDLFVLGMFVLGVFFGDRSKIHFRGTGRIFPTSI